MTIRTLMLFLVGNRQAILDLASDRRALWVGLLFVISAGFAREYDARSLFHEPLFFFIPLGASLVTSFVLFNVLIYPDRRYFRGRDRLPHYFFAYTRLLTLFWMTAPLAWLYAVPYERFLSLDSATLANIITLAIVAAWRVALMVRVASVLYGYSTVSAFFRVLLFGDILVLLVILIPNVPLIAFMGGIVSLAEKGLMVASVQNYLFSAALLIFPLLLLGVILTAPAKRNRGLTWHGPKSPAELSTSPEGALWVLAGGSVAVWILILPLTQPAQLLRMQIEHDLKSGRISEALTAMSEHAPTDFPPSWDPPPGWSLWMEEPRLLDVMEVIANQPPAPWVRERYLSKLRKYFGSRWAFTIIPTKEAPNQMAKLFLLLPEGPGLAAEFPYGVEFVLRHADLTSVEKARLEAFLNKAKE